VRIGKLFHTADRQKRPADPYGSEMAGDFYLLIIMIIIMIIIISHLG